MSDLNRLMIIGRLTREPELRQTGSGTSYCRISIANNRNYSVNGERKEEVSFFNCVAWGRQAEIINQYCRKGKQVAIDGRLQQRSWVGQDGKKQYATDIVIESLQMLGFSDSAEQPPVGENLAHENDHNSNCADYTYQAGLDADDAPF